MANPDQIKDQIASARAKYAAEVARIRADQKLTTEAKRADIKAAHESAKQEHARLLSEYNEAVRELSARHQRAAFGVPKGSAIESDDSKAARRRLHADALARAEAVAQPPDGPQALQRMLRQAVLAEDESLGVAVAAAAARAGARDVLAEFSKAFPARGEAVNDFIGHLREHESFTSKVRANFALAEPALPPDVS